jgi:hypothetical protein
MVPQPAIEAIAGILARSIVRIRASGWENDARWCAIEADHVHNLPDLIVDWSLDRLA